jgi:hypothetical protein
MVVCVMKKHQIFKSLPDVTVVIACLISIGLSCIESRLNTDAHHWGFMYAGAADIIRGMIPYKETYIIHGVMTSVLQGLSLKILWNNVVTIGIVTGIFYALNIYISYRLWQKILNKWLSCLSALLMFLVHGYIIYPWANYFAYTFLLVSVYFLTAPPEKGNRYILSGIFLTLSYLARQSLLPILAPMYVFFIYLMVHSDRKQLKLHLINILKFHLGVVMVFAPFMIFIAIQSAINDWINQNFKVYVFFNIYFDFYETVRFFLYRLLAPLYRPRVDARLFVYSLVFLSALYISVKLFFKGLKKNVEENERLLFLYGSVTLFGYLQAFHIYEIFRLQSASALGIGLLILMYNNLTVGLKKWRFAVFLPPVFLLMSILSSSLLFTITSSVYYPWDKTLLFSDELNEPEGIGVLRYKLYDSVHRLHYWQIAEILEKYRCRLSYLVNYSHDSYIPYISDHYKRIQRIPSYNYEYSEKSTEMLIPDEREKVGRVLSNEQAILFAAHIEQVPSNYHVVRKIKSLESYKWVTPVTYVAVPRTME